MDELIKRSQKIREQYHQLEQQHHGSNWTIEEDALAFLTDAALVGRLTMAQQERWPKGQATESAQELEYKLGECIWWLTILADRMGLNIDEVTNRFLTQMENRLGDKVKQ